MEINLEKETLNTVKAINNELTLEKDLKDMKESFSKIIGNNFDKMVNYTIKAMPIPDSCKDILKDVKEAFKTKDFKTIVKTAINSSIREGLEILGLDKESLKNLKTVANTAMKGGVLEGIKAGVDIVAKKYLKNSISGSYVYEFFEQVKNIPFTKEFSEKINNTVNKIDKAKDEFLDMCKNFKEAYSSFDLDKMSELSEKIKEKAKEVKNDKQCIREASNIQNMNKLASLRNQKLTDAQLKLCNIM